MDFIQDALLRAKVEGKIDPQKLPWDKTQSSTPKKELLKRVIPHPSVPRDLYRDFQQIIENIFSTNRSSINIVQV